MILWLIVIIAIIYYFGKENGYFNSHNNNHNQRPYNSDHRKDQGRFPSKEHQMNQNHDEVIYDIDNGQALKIARERYGSGEITKEEFEEIKNNLRK